mgnify:CR=1 FL=1
MNHRDILLDRHAQGGRTYRLELQSYTGILHTEFTWVFLFWCGVFLARLWRPGRGEPPAALRPLCAIGRNTLLVYMLHQP